MILIWNEREGEGATGKHLLGKIAHEGLGRGVKVFEHFVRAPLSNEKDDVRVNPSTELLRVITPLLQGSLSLSFLRFR